MQRIQHLLKHKICKLCYAQSQDGYFINGTATNIASLAILPNNPTTEYFYPPLSAFRAGTNDIGT
jgi:hypothetical protein